MYNLQATTYKLQAALSAASTSSKLNGVGNRSPLPQENQRNIVEPQSTVNSISTPFFGVPGCPSLLELIWLPINDSSSRPSCFCDQDDEAFDADGSSVSVVCLNLTDLAPLRNAVQAIQSVGKRLFSLTINGSQLEDGTFVGGFFKSLNVTPVRFAIKLCFDEDGNANRTLNLGRDFFTTAQIDVLKSFVISDCTLSDISEIPDQVKRLVHLEQLHLNRVGLKGLKNDDLDGLDRLQILDLNDNDIAYIPRRLFEKSKNLRVINLGSNWVNETSLRAFSNRLSRLTILDLSDNNISALTPKSFEKQTHLETLILSQNFLRRISRNTFLSLNHLQHVFLDKNLIQGANAIPFALPSSIRTLDLGKNFIANFPDFSKANLPNLTLLSLNDNELTTIPTGRLDKLYNLATLYLGANQKLSSIGKKAFYDLHNLRDLDLSYANLSEFDSKSYFGVDSHLINLWLPRTNLGDHLAPTSFSALPNLRNLDLYGASITSIRAGVLDPLKKLTSINLAGNDFVCDKKRINYLAKWLKKNVDNSQRALQFRVGQVPVCADPAELMGLPLYSLSE
uniref:Uncharacterized protein n=1 Tax=Romanomermis culicivorax TaxID=13658 RepID=A0A915IZG1_ROMCU